MATSVLPRIGLCAWNSEHRFVAYTPADRAAHCPTCPPVTTEAYGQPWEQRAGIRWATVKARTTSTACSGACTSAKSDRCACECGGRNHGRSLGLAR